MGGWRRQSRLAQSPAVGWCRTPRWRVYIKMGIFSKIRRVFQPKFVKFENVRLPPRHARFCTTNWKSDEFFVKSAEREVDRLIELCGLSEKSSLLDIGSGQGRLAIGIQRRLPKIKRYLGIDIHARSVAWCKTHIEAHSSLSFMLLDAGNKRYNPSGATVDAAFRLPLASESFDVAFLYSVFTHMLTDDVAAYLKEIRRVLAPGGKMLATFYVEDGVPDCEENPPGYMEAKYGVHSGPLHRVRFSRSFVTKLLGDAGLKLERLDHQCEPQTGQSVAVAVARD